MIDVSAVLAMHEQTVARWHHQPLDNLYQGFLGLACLQHQFNYQLWHEEDIARSPDVGDARIAQVKRAIDRFNQQRNDAIEKLDDWLTDALAGQCCVADPSHPTNTETPGSAVDRLSIIALRIYHLDEQAARDDAGEEHRANVTRKAAICRLQRDELANSLRQLLDDITTGRKRHRTYRQFKMYNDPTLNPYLYPTTPR